MSAAHVGSIQSEGSSPVEAFDERSGLLSSNVTAESTAAAGVEVVSAPRKSSFPKALFNLLNNVLGTGGLGLAATFANAGLAGGVLGVALVGSVAAVSLLLLAHFAHLHPQHSATLQQLARHRFGANAAFAVGVFVLLFMWSSGVLLLQFIQQSLQQLFTQALGSGHWYASGPFLVSMIGLLVLLPLAQLRTFSGLAFFSLAGVVLVAYVFGFVLVDAIVFLASGQPLPRDINYGFNWSLAFVLAFPTFCFAYMTHIAFISFVGELERPTRARINALVILAIGICGTFYILLGTLVYLRIGAKAPSDALSFYPLDYVPAIIARAALVTQSTIGFPLGLMVGRLTFRSMFMRRWGEPGHLFYLVFAVAWIGSQLLLAIFVPSIQLGFVFVGGTTPMIFIFIVPYLFAVQHWRKIWVIIPSAILGLLGIALAVIAVVATFLNR